MAPDTDRARALFLHRFVFRIAFSAGSIFAWVIVFRVCFLATHSLEFGLALTAALYALSQVIAFLLTPLTGAALRFGVRRALVYGTLICAASFAVLSFVFVGAELSREAIFWLVANFVVLHGMYRALYWIPYRTEVSHTLAKSPHAILSELGIALMPAIAGYLLTSVYGGAHILFVGVAIGILVSCFFLRRVPDTPEPYLWSYLDTLRALTARQSSSAVGLFMFDGFQGAVLLIIWPLAAFLVLGQSFQSLGAVLAATLCIAFLGRYVVRWVMQTLRIAHSPLVLASVVFSSWIVRLAAGTPGQLLIADVYYNSGNSPRRFSIDTLAQEQTADGGHFVDEYTAIKEMSLMIGRFAACTLFVALLLLTQETIAFGALIILAAVSGAASVFLAHRLEREAF